MVHLTLKFSLIIIVLFSEVIMGGNAVAQETDRQLDKKSLLDLVEIAGFVAFATSHVRSSDDETSKFTMAEELDLGIGLKPHNWIGTDVIWIHQIEEEGGYNLEIVRATAVVGPPEGTWWLETGIQFLPFTRFELAEVRPANDSGIAPFETQAIIDPLSFDYGSKREKSMLLGASLGSFVGTVYGYYGKNKYLNDTKTGFGAAVSYEKILPEDRKLTSNLSFIDHLGNLDIFQNRLYEQHIAASDEAAILDKNQKVPGWAIATKLEMGNISVTGEYMLAQKRFSPGLLDFAGKGALPSAWMFEASYGFTLAGRSGDIMLGYQGSAEAVSLKLPVSRYVGVLNIDLWDQKLFGTLEWMHDRDYKISENGTGGRLGTYTARLAIEF